jgi:phosphohistidine phosphatase
MKTLVIIRHGKSSWAYPDLEDFYRPLKPRGINDAFVIGEELQKQDVFPDLILSSPAIRAMNTAIIIARKLDFPLQRIRANESIYEASTYHLLNLISNVEDNNDKLMIFGHNPSFTSLINQLQNDPLYNLPTCGVIAIELPIDSWSKIATSKGEKVLELFPKELEKV